jgi:RNA polymerase sigma-70 factor (ECF subfamily)
VSSDQLFPQAISWSAHGAEQADASALPNLSDADLMARVKVGDDAAFAILMRRHARVVLAVGRRVLRDQGAAEELVQDVFLLVYKRSQQFDPERGALRAWLIQIAYNEAFRSRQRHRLRDIYEDQSVDRCADLLESIITPEYHALVAQSEQALRQTFEQLNSKQRETMELYFFEGYTLREISERMGDSLDNVRHHYYRGLKALKEIIGSTEVKDSST